MKPVAIIGGGITGLTAALQLRAKGIQSYGIGPALSPDDFANHAWHSDVEPCL